MKIILFGDAKDSLPLQVDRKPIKNLKRIITFHWPTMTTENGLPHSIFGDEHYYEEKKFIHLYYKQAPSRRGIRKRPEIDNKTTIDEYINNPTLQFRYGYTENLHLERMDYYNIKNTASHYYKYTTDNEGNILSQVQYALDGKFIKKIEYEFEFDSFGNPIRIINKANADIFTELEYEYTKSNIIMKRFVVKHRNRQQLTETEYSYRNNDIGTIVIIKHSDLSTNTKTETYKVFDLFNNLVEKSQSKGNRLAYHSLNTYEYDENNNWISKRTRFTGFRIYEKEGLTTRRIEYN